MGAVGTDQISASDNLAFAAHIEGHANRVVVLLDCNGSGTKTQRRRIEPYQLLRQKADRMNRSH